MFKYIFRIEGTISMLEYNGGVSRGEKSILFSIPPPNKYVFSWHRKKKLTSVGVHDYTWTKIGHNMKFWFIYMRA